MTDPNEGLISFISAYNAGEIIPAKCTLHDDLYVLQDDANGTPRLTYALIEEGVVKGTAVYVLAEPVEGIPCFALGYAVLEKFRNQGIGSTMVKKSLEEIHQGFKKHIPTFYVEAVISRTNVASNQIALRTLSSERVECDEALLNKSDFG
ncbi:hypothetical protein TUM17577_45360 [Enterobacter asburiae]|nr:hypothetical protein TUM17577_45360 [Enterobacter asburiae]